MFSHGSWCCQAVRRGGTGCSAMPEEWTSVGPTRFPNPAFWCRGLRRFARGDGFHFRNRVECASAREFVDSPISCRQPVPNVPSEKKRNGIRREGRGHRRIQGKKPARPEPRGIPGFGKAGRRPISDSSTAASSPHFLGYQQDLEQLN